MMAGSEMMVDPIGSLVKEQPSMLDPSRRQLLDLARFTPAGLALGLSPLASGVAPPADIHLRLLDLGARQEGLRRGSCFWIGSRPCEPLDSLDYLPRLTAFAPIVSV
jgi:hypothetical protein